MDEELKQMLDLHGGSVEVEVADSAGNPDFLTLWVNVDGLCRLRVGGIRKEEFSARIKRNLIVRRPK